MLKEDEEISTMLKVEDELVMKERYPFPTPQNGRIPTPNSLSF